MSYQGAKTWITELRQKTQSNAIIMLCGNKHDLRDKRQVREGEAASYARVQGPCASKQDLCST